MTQHQPQSRLQSQLQSQRGSAFQHEHQPQRPGQQRGRAKTDTALLTDRAIGAVLASAVGDALGAPYEFKPPLAGTGTVVMKAGGGWELGEWTDDTAMAVPILRALADGRRLDDPDVLAGLVCDWIGWSRGAKDVGIQIGTVLRAVASRTGGRGAPEGQGVALDELARTAARQVHEDTGRSAGNGSLMRTGPVALGYLRDLLRDEAGAELAGIARRISDLTHFDDDAGDACVLWSLAIRHAVRTGTLALRAGLDALPAERRTLWSDRIDEAERLWPWEFPRNGWVVQALQAAWSAIIHAETLPGTLELAVCGGNDADTVAAIAGSLAGAWYGASALPFRWRRHLHGWAGADRVGTARTLTTLAALAIREGKPDASGWPTAARQQPTIDQTLVRHPADDGVWLGDLAALDHLPAGVDALVSLCRVGTSQGSVPAAQHDEVWLIDQPGKNANLGFVLADAADAVAELRAEGRTVLLHCLEARSRTAAVAAGYAVRHKGIGPRAALDQVTAALPNGAPEDFLVAAALALEPAPAGDDPGPGTHTGGPADERTTKPGDRR